MPKYLLTGISQPATFELEPGFNTVGRNPTNDLRVKDATVSSFHCEIVLTDDALLVRDLGSSNGTFVDGRRVVESTLSSGSVLRVGSFELKLECSEEAEAVRISVPTLPGEHLPSQAVLPNGFPACLNHPRAHATFECTRCQKKLCPDCVHVLRLTGGQTRVFCPSCSGLCDSLPIPEGVSREPAKKPPSFLGRLTQTIRIRQK